MKVFIGGSKVINQLDNNIIDIIKEYIKQGAEILIGDCFGVDALVQKELSGYDKVTVYSPFEKARNNNGNWTVNQIGDKKRRKGFLLYAAKDSAMAVEADCGFMLWDGKSKGTFINMINLLLLNKTVCVYFMDNKKVIKEVNSFDDLEVIIPRNSHYVSRGDTLPKELYEPCIKSCGFSKEMEEHLLSDPVSKHDVLEIILGAPITINKKSDLLASLCTTDNWYLDILYLERNTPKCFKYLESYVKDSQVADTFVRYVHSSSFSCAFEETEKAISNLNLEKGSIFTLEEAWYDIDTLEETDSLDEPFTSFDAVITYIRKTIEEEREDVEDDEDLYGWYELLKWVPADEKGNMRCAYKYVLCGDEIFYYEKNPWRSFEEDDKHYPDYEDHIVPKEYYGCLRYHDLNIPIPFKPGDIVTVNCVPFEERKQVILIEVDNRDCCGVQALYRHYDGLWRTGALKHNDCWDRYYPLMSTLYRLSRFTGELKEEEKLMGEVQKYVLKDEKNGSLLWHAIFKGEISKNKHGGVTEENIREFIEKSE